MRSTISRVCIYLSGLQWWKILRRADFLFKCRFIFFCVIKQCLNNGREKSGLFFKKYQFVVIVVKINPSPRLEAQSQKSKKEKAFVKRITFHVITGQWQKWHVWKNNHKFLLKEARFIKLNCEEKFSNLSWWGFLLVSISYQW